MTLCGREAGFRGRAASAGAEGAQMCPELLSRKWSASLKISPSQVYRGSAVSYIYICVCVYLHVLIYIYIYIQVCIYI